MKSKEYLDAVAILGGLYNEYYCQNVSFSWHKNYEKDVANYNDWFAGVDSIDPSDHYYYSRYCTPYGYCLQTPLDQCLVGMRKLIPEFNKVHWY